jgi:hypothetical protein
MHYVGIDWAAEKHDVCLMAEDGRVLPPATSDDLVARSASREVDSRPAQGRAGQLKTPCARKNGLLASAVSTLAPASIRPS